MKEYFNIRYDKEGREIALDFVSTAGKLLRRLHFSGMRIAFKGEINESARLLFKQLEKLLADKNKRKPKKTARKAKE